jgi:prophage regulatory protein
LDDLVAEGILGKTIEEVAVHLMRNALHREWVPRPVSLERPRPSDQRAGQHGGPKRTDPTRDTGYPLGKRLLRLPEVSHVVGLRRSTIYGMVNRGTFPAPKKLGGRSVAWLQSEIESWITAKDHEF